MLSNKDMQKKAACLNSTCAFGRQTVLECPHPFSNQIVRVSVHAGIPFSLQKDLFNKPLSGLHVQVARDLAESLKFVAKLSVGAGGSFNSNNGSLGPGILKDVSYS